MQMGGQKTELAHLVPPGQVHATAICCLGQGVLLVGPSGSGKSTLALELMALGAELISDDLVWITDAADAGLILSRPPGQSMPLLIEARGLGLLRATQASPRALDLIVDMSCAETERLPLERTLKVAGRSFRYIQKVEHRAFPAMILQYLRGSKLESS